MVVLNNNNEEEIRVHFAHKQQKIMACANYIWMRLRLSRIYVYALVGKAGTGKSFRARLVCERYNISYLIDDGLLIYNDRIVCGHSAKKENTLMGAVRVALFDEQAHAKQVRKCLQTQKPRSILIIGTSQRMIKHICASLNVPMAHKIIAIEDIASTDEIQRAISARKAGRHVIPVPRIEVRRTYPRMLTQSAKILYYKSKAFFSRDKLHEQYYESTIVHKDVTHNMMPGQVSVSKSVVIQMIMHCIAEQNQQISVSKISIKQNASDEYIITCSIRVPIELSNYNFFALRNYVFLHIERFGGITIAELNIVIVEIVYTVENNEVTYKKN